MKICCGRCDKEIEVSDSDIGAIKTCPHCGIGFVLTSEEFLFVCRKCGARHPEWVEYCPSCGNRMNPEPRTGKRIVRIPRKGASVRLQQEAPAPGPSTLRKVVRIIEIILYACATLYFLNIVFKLHDFDFGSDGGSLDFFEQYVKVKCPICRADTLYHWKNSDGEKILKEPKCLCLSCHNYFYVPEKYR